MFCYLFSICPCVKIASILGVGAMPQHLCVGRESCLILSGNVALQTSHSDIYLLMCPCVKIVPSLALNLCLLSPDVHV